MSGFGEKAVERWNDWQLIVLVLLSLSVQLLLLGTAGVRRRIKPRAWSKVYFWALHVGSRYVATYPLGILSRASTSNPNADIQAFWAALLLLHLGRPDDFTALSLEDNTIWPRQLFDLTVQALVTAYVFSRYCVDQDFKLFIVPFALISLAGLLKCGEQVFALKQATMEALVKSVLGTPDAGPDYADTMDRVDGMLRSGVLPSINIDNKRLGRPDSDAPEFYVTKGRADQIIEQQLAVDIIVSPKADERRADDEKIQQKIALDIIRSAHSLFSRFKILFADGIFSFEDRRESQAVFSGKDAKWAFKVIEIELSFVYDRLYTKASVSRSQTGLIIRLASLLLTLAGSLYTFFVTMHASQYWQRHRCVTYTLLAGAVLTEAVILTCYSYSIWSLVDSKWLKRWSVNLVQNRSRWSGYMAQSNLISFCLRKLPSDAYLVAVFRGRRGARRHSDSLMFSVFQEVLFTLMVKLSRELWSVPLVDANQPVLVRTAIWQYLQRPSVLKQLQSKSFWKKYKKTRYVPVQDKLEAFIFDQVKEKEGIFIQREKRYQATGIPEDCCKPFIDCRGDWVLEIERVDDCLGWSFQGKEFDESLLLWHIATDLCFRQDINQGNNTTGHQVSSGNGSTDQQIKEHMENGMEMSNYLLYIMVVHPLMLSSSTTMAIKRCRDTCAETRRHFLKEHIETFTGIDALNEENAHTSLLKVEATLRASAVKGDKSKSVLWDGCFLAKQLNEIPDMRKKWRVISRVWVEMLCYAAVQCGGYQHAERLKEGGELITFVCLLMTHLGMGKHYRTEVGDAYAHLSPFTAQSSSRPAPPAQAQGIQENATISRDGASSSGHAQQAATVAIDEASTSGHGHQ